MPEAASPRETADRSDVVFTAVASLGALSAIATGPDGLASSMRRGFTLVDFSTLPLQEKEAVRAALVADGIAMVDCPISGTGSQVAIRDAVFMASGERTAIEEVLPILRRLVPTRQGSHGVRERQIGAGQEAHTQG